MIARAIVDKRAGHQGVSHRMHASTECIDAFGAIVSVQPTNAAGRDHQPCIRVHFEYGVSLELGQATAAGLSRCLQESLASLAVVADFNGADLSGSATDLRGDDV
jgi:hypothetical protein